MLVDVVFEDPRWEAAGLSGLAEAAAQAVIAHLQLVPPFGDGSKSAFWPVTTPALPI